MGSPERPLEKSRRRPRFRIIRARRRVRNTSSQQLLHRSASLEDVTEEHDARIIRRSLSLSTSNSLNEVNEYEEEDDEETTSSTTSTFVDDDGLSLAAATSPMGDLEGLIIREEQEEMDDLTNLREAMQVWVNDTQALVQSREMSSFLMSSGMLLGQVAMIPITIPMQVVSHTTGFVGHLLTTSTAAVDRVLGSDNPVDTVVQNISNLGPIALHIVNQIKDEIGSTLLGLLTGASPLALLEDDSHTQTSSSNDQESPMDFLDRLRLEYPSEAETSSLDDPASPAENESPEQDGHPSQVPRRLSSEVSKFILRVCDLALFMEDSQGRSRSLHCIDLSKEYGSIELTLQAVDSLIAGGLALICTNPATSVGINVPTDLVINWKPENGTERHLRKMHQADDWIGRLSKHVLLWSGKFRDRHAFPHGDVPFFLSRGILPLSPKELLTLFWDNNSCHRYNKYCTGRTSLLTIEDGLDRGTRVRGTKIVRSETQVPFTGMSVIMSTLMHARKVDTADGPCYMIVSRTVQPGKAGVHFGAHHHHTHNNTNRVHSKSTSKNELLWGVNMIRCVPGHPNKCELTAVSQVKSGLVPPFLTQRVGIMAVESCFSALREL